MIVPNYILWMSPVASERPGQIIFSPGNYVSQRYQARDGLRWYQLAPQADAALSVVSQGQPIFREYKNRRGQGLHQNVLASYLLKLLPSDVSIAESPDHDDDQLVFTPRGWQLMRLLCGESD